MSISTHFKGSKRALTGQEKRTIALLGLPTFGLSLSITLLVTYGPVIAREFTDSNAIVGLIIATEGMIALFLPVLAGSFSDHMRTRLGGRLPFIIVATPFAAAALLAVGFAGSIAVLILGVLLFFTAYYVMYEPYRALYPDLVHGEAAGRAQGIQATWRSVGTGLALVSGGFLFALSPQLPFVLSAVLIVATIAIFLVILLRRIGVPRQTYGEIEPVKTTYIKTLGLLRQRSPLRNYVAANALWELTLAALKSFIVLYLTIGLGYTIVEAAAFIGIAAVAIFIATPFSGKLADRFGKVRVMRVSSLVFGLGLLVPAFTTNPWAIVAILLPTAVGGAVILALPYALLIPMMPKHQHGRLSGLYSTSRGIGIMLGPLLAGAAISLTSGILPANGYSAMWLVCGISMLLSLRFLSALR